MRTYPNFFNLQKLPDCASKIASTVFGQPMDMLVTSALAQRIFGNAQGLTEGISQDLACYAVFGASGVTGYARVRTRRMITVLVPVAFETGSFDVRVTALRPEAGVAWAVLISLPEEVIWKRWVNEMIEVPS